MPAKDEDDQDEILVDGHKRRVSDRLQNGDDQICRLAFRILREMAAQL